MRSPTHPGLRSRFLLESTIIPTLRYAHIAADVVVVVVVLVFFDPSIGEASGRNTEHDYFDDDDNKDNIKDNDIDNDNDDDDDNNDNDNEGPPSRSSMSSSLPVIQKSHCCRSPPDGITVVSPEARSLGSAVCC